MSRHNSVPSRWTSVEVLSVSTLFGLGILGLTVGILPDAGSLWNNAGLGILTAAVISGVVASMEIQSRHRDDRRALDEKKRDEHLSTLIRDSDKRQTENLNKELTRAICQLALTLNGDFCGFQGQDMNLHGLNFRGKDMSGANLRGAVISDANFADCTFENSILSRIVDASGASFTNSRFKNVDFSNSDLRGVSLGGCRFTGCNFSGTERDDNAFDEATVEDCAGISES